MGFHPTAFANYAAGHAQLTSRIIHSSSPAITNSNNIHMMIRQPAHLPLVTSYTATSTCLNLSPLDGGMDFAANVHSVWDSTMHIADAVVTGSVTESGTLLEHVTTAAHHLAEQAEHNAMALEAAPSVPVDMAEGTLSAIGHDLLLFLLFSVVVDPLAKILGLAPVLLYLLLGFVAGPYGLSLFNSGTEVNEEIGDFGIVFLLFVEGLQLSPERLKALGGFFSLGLAQLLISVGAIFFFFFFGGPYLLPIVQDVRVPIDPQTLQLLDKPVVAFSVAAAGALSSSAFVLPILKERKWEKRPDGIAALSILLLQDLAVAPLLVALPLIAEYDRNGGSIQDPTALGILATKATIGFGGVLVLASVVLRRVFQVVASYGSSQTFVAASLLVAVGMGVIADDLGLSSTTGAFAAGVLLAESGYRAQIEADIKPFEGILLGVFFVTAGASLDPLVCLDQWSTLLAGIAAFITIKVGIILAAGQFALGLTRADSARVALLLAGGGEFAFVVFKLAKNLDVLSDDLADLLTASVIISMSLTPLLGIVADKVGNILEEMETDQDAKLVLANGDSSQTEYDLNISDDLKIREVFELFDEDGNGSIDAMELQKVLIKPDTNTMLTLRETKTVMAKFDENNDGLLQFDEFANLWTSLSRGTNRGVSDERRSKLSIANAVVVCGYGRVGQALCSSIERANNAGIGGGVSYVAFSCQPSSISAGVVNGANVVYGDGASPNLIKASGVESPSAFAIVYQDESKCLSATLRLREAYPSVPIYARASSQEMTKKLKEAGVTEVVVETETVAEAMRTLVSRYGDKSIALMKAALWTENVNGEEIGEALPFTQLELADLAFECDRTPEELKELYELFSTGLNRNDNGQVQLEELRDTLMRNRKNSPLDDKSLAEWMGYEEALSKWYTGEAETTWISFPDFVRFSVRKLDNAVPTLETEDA